MLEGISHRPWPPPSGSWALQMVWEDLLFAHWPVESEAIRVLLPPELELDTFGGQAWIGIVPFRMCNTRLRGFPSVPGTGSFLELNVRTYVKVQNKPGVWFFSLDASSRGAVCMARRFFHLPYFDTAMRLGKSEGSIHYESRRTHRKAAAAEFHARYRPVESVFRSAPGSLEHWLTERYCLYSTDETQRLYRGEIHHAPWPLQWAEVELTSNSMTNWLGLQLPPHAPHLLFAKRLEVVAWRLRLVEKTT